MEEEGYAVDVEKVDPFVNAGHTLLYIISALPGIPTKGNEP